MVFRSLLTLQVKNRKTEDDTRFLNKFYIYTLIFNHFRNLSLTPARAFAHWLFTVRNLKKLTRENRKFKAGYSLIR